MKRNNFGEDVYGYSIIRDGHTMFAEDVCRLLDRLDFLEEERLKLSNNHAIAPCNSCWYEGDSKGCASVRKDNYSCYVCAE